MKLDRRVDIRQTSQISQKMDKLKSPGGTLHKERLGYNKMAASMQLHVLNVDITFSYLLYLRWVWNMPTKVLLNWVPREAQCK